MNPKKFSRISFRLGMALLLLATAFAAAVTPARAAPEAPDRNWEKYERNALKRIMNRDLYMLEIAKVCLTQATHSELLSLCQRLNNTLPQEITKLQSWLLSWYDLNYTPRLTLEQRIVLRHLGIPRLHGAKFEIQSMKLYRMLFKQNAAEEDKCSKHAPHPEMAAFCAQGLVTLNQDFRNVLTWLCNWYDRCYGGTEPSMMDLLEEDW
jgi:hypothetical protein